MESWASSHEGAPTTHVHATTHHLYRFGGRAGRPDEAEIERELGELEHVIDARVDLHSWPRTVHVRWFGGTPPNEELDRALSKFGYSLDAHRAAQITEQWRAFLAGDSLGDD